MGCSSGKPAATSSPHTGIKGCGMKAGDVAGAGGTPPPLQLNDNNMSVVLKVDSSGLITGVDAEAYIARRRQEVANRLQAILQNSQVANWLESFTEADLHKEDSGKESGDYLGNASCKPQSVAALQMAKTTQCPVQRVASIEEFILSFCGFRTIKAKYIVNAVHFQFSVDTQKLLSTQLAAPSAVEEPSAAEKALFDEADIAYAELLLRVVVETDDGLVANPFSPGIHMSYLQKLPLFAQLVMVLINTVEAEWYQQSIPGCPMAINLYASLLTDDAPIEQMIGGAKVVEVMEMTKGATRGPGVVKAVRQIRERGAIVMLDDYDMKHPAIDSKPDGIKLSVMANASYSLQALKSDGAPVENPTVEESEINDSHFMDFFHGFVPQTQPDIKWLVMEGSENCLKSEVKPGPPLDFKEKKATIASAHVYQTAARVLCAMQPDLKILHQGGRALYDDEEFDKDALQVMKRLSKPPQAERAGAGTMAWMGQEAARRAIMRVRPLVCGVTKKNAAVA